MTRLQRWLLVDQAFVGYLAACVIGGVPILLAWSLGVHVGREIPASSYLAKLCDRALEGFFERENWILYPVFLPVALFLLRRTVAQFIGISERSPIRLPQYEAFRINTSQLVHQQRLLVFAILATLIVSVLDMYHVVRRYFVQAETCPNDLDWGWYGIVFDEVPFWGVVLLNSLTTIEQMFLAIIGFLLMGFMWLYNQRYLNSIYLRSGFRFVSDSGKYESRDSSLEGFVLDLNDGNLRFGLGDMMRLFNWQILMLSLVGFFMLVSRYNNVDRENVTDNLRKIYQFLKSNFEFGSTGVQPPLPLEQITQLLPDLGQWALAVIWAILWLVVMRPAHVKLLPFRYVGYEDGRVAYLKEIVPPETEFGGLLASGDKGDVDQVADAFKAHAFWPAGNRKAAELIFAAALVFLLILFPVPISLEGVPPMILFIILSLAFAKYYLYTHKYRLNRVNETLVSN